VTWYTSHLPKPTESDSASEVTTLWRYRNECIIIIIIIPVALGISSHVITKHLPDTSVRQLKTELLSQGNLHPGDQSWDFCRRERVDGGIPDELYWTVGEFQGCLEAFGHAFGDTIS